MTVKELKLLLEYVDDDLQIRLLNGVRRGDYLTEEDISIGFYIDDDGNEEPVMAIIADW